MELLLGPELARARREFRAFVDRAVAPLADRHDREQALEPGVIRELAERQFLAADLGAGHGGLGLEPLALGLLMEELGRGCSSVRSLTTVHGMVAHTIARWRTPAQRAEWLPRLARGEWLAALALRRHVAWRIQELAEGGLSPRALERIEQLAPQAKARWHKRVVKPAAADHSATSQQPSRDPCLPPVGTRTVGAFLAQAAAPAPGSGSTRR